MCCEWRGLRVAGAHYVIVPTESRDHSLIFLRWFSFSCVRTAVVQQLNQAASGTPPAQQSLAHRIQSHIVGESAPLKKGRGDAFVSREILSSGKNSEL
jgi:hypothetical protein